MQRPPVRTIADQVFFVTAFIEAFTPDARSAGTGLLQYPNGDS